MTQHGGGISNPFGGGGGGGADNFGASFDAFEQELMTQQPQQKQPPAVTRPPGGIMGPPPGIGFWYDQIYIFYLEGFFRHILVNNSQSGGVIFWNDEDEQDR